MSNRKKLLENDPAVTYSNYMQQDACQFYGAILEPHPKKPITTSNNSIPCQLHRIQSKYCTLHVQCGPPLEVNLSHKAMSKCLLHSIQIHSYKQVTKITENMENAYGHLISNFFKLHVQTCSSIQFKSNGISEIEAIQANSQKTWARKVTSHTIGGDLQVDDDQSSEER